MRVKLLPLLFLFSITTSSFAQQAPILTAANVAPVVGDKFVIHNCITNGVQPGPSGADTSWDFSNLVTINGSGSADTGRTATSSSTEPAYLFPGSNTAIVASPSSTVIGYYISAQSRLSLNGLYVSPTQYTTYSDPMDQLQFPFSFNNIFTDGYSATIVSALSGRSVSSKGSVTTSADAWGTLTLPGAVGNVVYPNTLRLHTIQSYTDSALLLGSTAETYAAETYTWYAPGYHNALLTIATVTGSSGTTTQVSYSALQLEGPEGLNTVQNKAASLDLYPNPASSELTIAYSTANAGHVHITLCDVLGRQAVVIKDGDTHGAQQLTCNVATLPKGVYFVNLQASATSVTKQVVIR